MSESHQTRLRRLRMRSWRRGMREMDIILGPYADAALSGLSGPDLDAYEALLCCNDQDLFGWFSGARPAPAPHAALVATILAQRATWPGPQN